MKDIPKIVCPVCGQEYLPVEIFIPDVFFGKPKEIMRDNSGKIEFCTGSDMNLEESYICDYCGNGIKVEANLSFTVSTDVEENFEEEYVSTFERPKKIKLEEVGLFDK